MVEFRPATVEEAVESIMRCVLKQSRVEQLAWFRVKQGDEFANQVQALVTAKWKKRNGR